MMDDQLNDMTERRQTPAGFIQEEKFDAHIKKASEFWASSIADKARISADVEDIKIALFSKDANNKFDQVGLLVTAKNMDNHITVICSIMSWGWKIVVGALGLVTALKAAGVL